jgi:hypothetical protein
MNRAQKRPLGPHGPRGTFITIRTSRDCRADIKSFLFIEKIHIGYLITNSINYYNKNINING